MTQQSIFRIRLDQLRFHSRIGVYDQERIVGNEFTVNITVSYPADDFQYENLDSTISYADIYDEIKRIMQSEHLLLESVAKEIADRIILRWPQINELQISILKCAPPITAISGQCGIDYLWKKN